MAIHLVEYSHEGSDWVVEIGAENADDAQARVRALATARYVGELGERIPAKTPLTLVQVVPPIDRKG